MNRRTGLIAGATALLAACASSVPGAGWTNADGAQPFETAASACSQISRGSDANFTICMAGRGWTKTKA